MPIRNIITILYERKWNRNFTLNAVAHTRTHPAGDTAAKEIVTLPWHIVLIAAMTGRRTPATPSHPHIHGGTWWVSVFTTHSRKLCVCVPCSKDVKYVFLFAIDLYEIQDRLSPAPHTSTQIRCTNYMWQGSVPAHPHLVRFENVLLFVDGRLVE